MFIILGGICCITWFIDTTPGESWVWPFRIGGAMAVIIPSTILIWAAFRKDRVPDFLAQMGGSYFERDGFCFHVLIEETSNQACQLVLYFQNQYERPCGAVVCVRPTKTVFVDQSKLKACRFEIHCGRAAFGKAAAGMTVPRDLCNQETTWDVTASVNYPTGRGSLLRVRNGMRVGKIGTDQVSAVRQTLTVLLALFGHASMTTPARLRLLLPKVESNTPDPPLHTVERFWELGDSIGALNPASRSVSIRG